VTDNVVRLGTGQSLAEENAEYERVLAAHQEHLDEAAEAHHKNLLTLLDNTRALVEAGKLDGLCIAGRNPENGTFMSVITLNTSDTRVDTYHAYAGVLGSMQQDVSDLACSGPFMNSDGSYFAIGNPEMDILGEEE
jgi:hypothetical protein